MNTAALKRRVEKLEAKRQPKRQQWIFVESEEDLQAKQKEEEPGVEYVYFRWAWDNKEVPF